MKIKIMSDSHGFHEREPQEPIDLLIHAGDATNPRNIDDSEQQFLKFWKWWQEYPAKYKVYVPGNHDVWLDSPRSKAFRKKENRNENSNILFNETIKIEHLKIFGSPFTPTFGVGWAFNKDRNKIGKLWAHIEEDTDIVITHGPPHTVLDLTIDKDNKLKTCGCKALLNRIKLIKPRYHIFGHIHDYKWEIVNTGTLIRNGITYINAAQVVDTKFHLGLFYPAKIIEL